MHTARSSSTSSSASRSLAVLGAVSAAAAVLTACGSMSMAPAFNQSSLPPTIQVPAGNKVAMETVGVGDITYECRDKANAPARPSGCSSAPTPS
jgi:transcription elongation factor